MPAQDAPAGLLVTGDLFFSSKVTGTASALGMRIDVTADPAEALSRLAAGGYVLLIIDLATPGLILGDLLAAVSADRRPRVIAFAAHVETGRLQAARDAGCDLVLPRSRFSAELPRLLGENLAN
jgi:CheY-like chemotaxis protein